MCDYIISCCSSVDVTSEQLTKRKVVYLPFKFRIGGKEFVDDLGKSLSYHEFYQAMRDGADTKTSQINVEEYVSYFQGLLTSGKKVLHITLSSGLSGTYNSARLAAKEINEKNGERVFVIDSLAASGGYGLLVDKLCDLRDEGKTLEEVILWAEENKTRLHHWFFTTTLTYYVRGGRVSKVSGFVGNLLKICPLLNVDENGKLIPRQKVLGKKKVIKEIVEKMNLFAEGGLDYNQKCYITHSDAEADAQEVKSLIEETFPKLNGKAQITSIGTTIGCHAGPETVALFFWGNAGTR